MGRTLNLKLEAQFIAEFTELEDERDEIKRKLDELKQARDENQCVIEKVTAQRSSENEQSALADRLAEDLRRATKASELLSAEKSKLQAENEALKRQIDAVSTQSEPQGNWQQKVDRACRDRDNFRAMLDSANSRICELESKLFGG